jgi:NADH dehydrogenase (ubiquinone) 1 alpha subcomplex subunit 6
MIQAPEITKQYLLSLPPPAIRAKIRQEFERHRYVQQLPVVDMLITKSNMELQETMNYWKQISHIMKWVFPSAPRIGV